MTSRAGVRLLAIAALGGVGVTVLAQRTAVKSLTVRVAPKTVHLAVVTIENLSSQSLRSWELEFVDRDGTVARAPARVKGGVALRLRQVDELFKSLDSGERRRLRFTVPDTFVPTSVRLTYASSGLDSEGDQSIYDEFDRQAAAHAASSQYWQRVLVQAPTEEAALRTYIKTHIDESVKLGIEDPGGTRAGLLDLLQACAPNAVARGARDRQQQYEYQSRLSAPPQQPRKIGPVTSATVTLEPATTVNEVVAYVMNERDVAADVWEVELYSLPESRAPFMTFTSRGGHDSRVTSSSLERPLGPREVRELPAIGASWEEGVSPLPRGVAKVAVFDDGHFDGSAERRDQLLAELANASRRVGSIPITWRPRSRPWPGRSRRRPSGRTPFSTRPSLVWKTSARPSSNW